MSPQSVLRPAGPQAQEILHLFWLYLDVVLGVLAVTAAVLLLAIHRRRLRHSSAVMEPPAPLMRESELPPAPFRAHALGVADEAQESRLKRRIFAAAAVTLVALFVLLGMSVAAGGRLQLLRAPEVTIQVIGHQWWWELRYEDAVASHGFVTANELHLPLGQVVELKLTSQDVIHSFWVPALHGKRDLIPGQMNVLRLRADTLGTFRGQCAEFCGLQHAQMAMQVIVERPEDFERWREGQRRPAAEPVSELERQGQQAFVAGSCALCHSVGGTPAGGAQGPDLTHLASRTTLAAGTLPNVRGHLSGWILNAQGIKPGNHMPSLALAPADLQSLLAYLEALR